MKADTREREKNPQIIEGEGKNYKTLIDINRKDRALSLEGTGSLIYDTLNKKIYVNLSERADAGIL